MDKKQLQKVQAVLRRHLEKKGLVIEQMNFVGYSDDDGIGRFTFEISTRSWLYPRLVLVSNYAKSYGIQEI